MGGSDYQYDERAIEYFVDDRVVAHAQTAKPADLSLQGLSVQRSLGKAAMARTIRIGRVLRYEPVPSPRFV